MFDIAWSELLLIAVVALIFIGPKELPALLATLGRLAAKARHAADDFRQQFEESMRDSGYQDLHENFKDIRALNPANHLRDTIGRAINQDYTKPASPPPAPPAPAAQESHANSNSAPEPQAAVEPQSTPPEPLPQAAETSKDRAA